MIFADSISGNLEKIEDAATKAAKVGADAVLFPECATTGYACDFGALKPAALRQALRSVAAVAARLQVHLLVGSPIFSGRRLYNALVVFDRRGRLIHRTPFALGPWLELDTHTGDIRGAGGGEKGQLEQARHLARGTERAPYVFPA
jgi:hypothetical protein